MTRDYGRAVPDEGVDDDLRGGRAQMRVDVVRGPYEIDQLVVVSDVADRDAEGAVGLDPAAADDARLLVVVAPRVALRIAGVVRGRERVAADERADAHIPHVELVGLESPFASGRQRTQPGALCALWIHSVDACLDHVCH